MMSNETIHQVLSVSYGVEYLCSDGHWYTGKASGADAAAALNECRARWKDGALGVRLIEFRKATINERVRGQST